MIDVFICGLCGKPHPENQLAFRVKCAQEWYEDTNEPTVVFIGMHGYDFTIATDRNLRNYTQVYRMPEGWVQ